MSRTACPYIKNWFIDNFNLRWTLLSVSPSVFTMPGNGHPHNPKPLLIRNDLRSVQSVSYPPLNRFESPEVVSRGDTGSLFTPNNHLERRLCQFVNKFFYFCLSSLAKPLSVPTFIKPHLLKLFVNQNCQMQTLRKQAWYFQ